MKKAVYDYKGKKYPSEKKMCEAYGTSVSTYQYRKKKGYSPKATLLGIKEERHKNNRKPVQDHEGITHKSKTAMCEFYNIPYYLFAERIKLGWDLKRALTTPVANSGHRNGHMCTDPDGEVHPSIRAMCEKYGVEASLYLARRKRGMSLEEALMLNKIKDHNGKAFHSESEMCDFYNIPIRTYCARIRRGWSKEKALTTPVRPKQPKQEKAA